MDLAMQIPRDAVLLRIFFGEDDKSGHQPLHEAIVFKAREMHLAGATVLRVTSALGILAIYTPLRFYVSPRICPW
jgi:PII-like signaling protein